MSIDWKTCFAQIMTRKRRVATGGVDADMQGARLASHARGEEGETLYAEKENQLASNEQST